MARSGCRWIGALVIAHVLAGSASARAGVVVEAGAPFTAGELREALAVRDEAAAEVAVHVVSPTVIEVATAGGVLRIELGDARGVEAARLVALQWTALGAVAAPAPAAPLAPPGLTAVAAPPPPPSSSSSSGLSLGLAAGIGLGLGAVDPTLSAVSGDVLWRRDHWRWGAGATWLHGSTVGAFDSLNSMDLGLVRAEAGIGFGRFSVLAGPALVAFHGLSGRLGVGAAASATFNAELIDVGTWRVFARGELDVTLQSIDYAPTAFVDEPQSPRFTASASLGVAWGSS